MLLTADIGNTNIVLALLDHGDRVVSQRRIPSGEVLPLAAYEDAVRQVLAGHDAPEGAVIGSVVPRLTEETARAIRSVTGLEALVVGPTTPAGLDIAIEEPETLGVDLLAADAAAAAEYPLPVVVFDFGTATTVTVVDRQRRYRGGVILAGVKLSLHALFSGTAQLPDIALEPPGKVICSVTEDSLQAGAIYGAAAMAGFAAYMKIDGFNILPVSSISMAATTFVGQNYGAGRLDRVKKGTWVTLAMGLVYTLATGALLLLGQDAIMHLFTNDETVVFFGEAAMHWFCPFYFLLSILHGLAGAVRGTGASIPPMVVLLVSLCLFRIVWIQWVLPLFSGIEGVFILYPVSWALGAGLMILYAWKGKWMEYHA